MRRSDLLVLLAVLLLYLLGAGLRLHSYPLHPVHIADSAMRYRYASMIGQGKAVPEIDYSIQYPEGLKVRSLLFLTEDWVVGHSYRLLARIRPGIPFDVFFRFFVSFFSSLTIPLVYLLGLLVWRERVAGLVSAVFYAVAPASFARVLGNYLREEFALPFIFASLILFLVSCTTTSRKKSYCTAICSGISLLVALSSWHLSQFFLLLFVVFAGLRFILLRDKYHSFMNCFAILVAFSVLAGIVNPPLRQRVFLASYTMLLAYSILIAYIVRRSFGTGRLGSVLILLSILLLSLFLSSPLSRTRAEYGHVYSLMIYKLRYLGMKPARPSLLPFDARSIWMAPFNSPSPRNLAYSLGLILPFAVWPLVRLIGRWIKGSIGEGGAALSYFAFLFIPLYLFVRRLEIFLIFFVAALIGGLFVKRRLFVLVLLPFLAFQLSESWNYGKITPYQHILARLPGSEWTPSIHDPDPWLIFKLVSERTDRDGVFLARIGASPVILLYANRRVVLHPIYEAKWIRDKVGECIGAFFGEEEELYRICQKYEVNYILYESNSLLDNSRDSDRYLTDNLNITKRCVAYRMHFAPEALHHFTLIFQTDYFRVFQVHPWKEQVSVPKDLPYAVQFDPLLFGMEGLDGPFDDERISSAWVHIRAALNSLQQGMKHMEEREYRRAAQALQRTLTTIPRMEVAVSLLGYCWLQAGDMDRAIELYERELALHPFRAEAHYGLGMVYMRKGNREKAAEEFRQSLAINPNQPELRGLLERMED